MYREFVVEQFQEYVIAFEKVAEKIGFLVELYDSYRMNLNENTFDHVFQPLRNGRYEEADISITEDMLAFAKITNHAMRNGMSMHKNLITICEYIYLLEEYARFSGEDYIWIDPLCEKMFGEITAEIDD